MHIGYAMTRRIDTERDGMANPIRVIGRTNILSENGIPICGVAYVDGWTKEDISDESARECANACLKCVASLECSRAARARVQD